MFRKLTSEFVHFQKQPFNFRMLIWTNVVYTLVMPVIDIFAAAYVMRNSDDPVKVVIYQLAIYTGIPLTFFINGFLLNKFHIKLLYSIGMMLSGISMMVMMSLETLDIKGIGIAGIIMGMSFGFYWANRDYLALSITSDKNRNYYYGLETFFNTMIAVVVPFCVGWFIELAGKNESANAAYRIVTAIVIIITIIASIVCFRGKFKNPGKRKFIYFKFHPYWKKLLVLASLKGLAQGYLITAPAMLILRLLGKEGALGTAQSIGAIIAAIVMYAIGRVSKPQHRIYIFSLGLILFFVAALCNGIFFNATGVILFMLFLLLAKPLLDISYYPIQFSVIDILAKIEKRNEFAYILNHEAGLYVGRLVGACTFILLAYYYSAEFALRYALIFITFAQLGSVFLASAIIKKGKLLVRENNIDEKEDDQKSAETIVSGAL